VSTFRNARVVSLSRGRDDDSADRMISMRRSGVTVRCHGSRGARLCWKRGPREFTSRDRSRMLKRNSSVGLGNRARDPRMGPVPVTTKDATIGSVELVGRVAILLALFGTPLIGIAVPLTSGVLLRRFSTRHSLSGVPSRVRPAVVAGALVLWVAISVGTADFLISIASFTAMGWGDSRRLAPMSEQIELLAIISSGMLLLIGCGIVLHRVLRRTSRPAPVRLQ
jgi:hypothetical protein